MKPTAVYLVGPMASGKSSVMAEVLDLLGLGTGDWFKVWPSATRSEFRGEPLEDIITGEVRGLYLGRHRGDFSGTDAIGLASHAEAMAWAAEAGVWPQLILGEGQRLGTVGFFAGLAARADLTVGHLTAPQAVLDARCQRRWDAQEKGYANGNVRPKESFRKSTATRAVNAVAGARLVGTRVVELDTFELSSTECARLLLTSAGILSQTTTVL